jgi:hypothetical protein
MSAWKYYILDDGAGMPYEIYRLRNNGKSFCSDQEPGSLFLARSDGSWSNHKDDIRGLLNASMRGDFDPDESEVSEAKALELLTEWQASGRWPGRP